MVQKDPLNPPSTPTLTYGVRCTETICATSLLLAQLERVVTDGSHFVFDAFEIHRVPPPRPDIFLRKSRVEHDKRKHNPHTWVLIGSLSLFGNGFVFPVEHGLLFINSIQIMFSVFIDLFFFTSLTHS